MSEEKLKKELTRLVEWQLRMEALEIDIDKIVRYMWQIEYNDWEEKENPEDHIFHSINNIKNWLESLRRNNEQY